MIFDGILSFPWWGKLLTLLVLVQITIAGVTLYLHRGQAHSAVDFHPVVSHFFRLWLWLTTGMVTKEWAAIHRKHHAKCETADDPHSPQILGINTVLWTGVVLYVKESHKPETMARYGSGTPDDWLERNVYARFNKYGILVTLALDVLLFGAVPGFLMWGVQMLWIPFWAAGVINGIGHYWGYRNFETEDAARNITRFGLWIGGEELHNNHHAYPTSAKFSMRWHEFDLGWLYLQVLSSMGLAKVRKAPPKVKLDPTKFEIDAATLQAVIAHRYDVLAKYATHMKRTSAEEIAKLRAKGIFADRSFARKMRTWLERDAAEVPAEHRAVLDRALESSPTLKTSWTMRQELTRLWQRSTLTTEQLTSQLRDWCERAEGSGVPALAQFSRRVRCYA